MIPLPDLVRRRLEGVVQVARARLHGNTMHTTWDLIFDAECLLRGETLPWSKPYTAEELIELIGVDNKQ